MATDAYETGWQLCQKLHGAHSGAKIVARLQQVSVDYVNMNMEWAYAGVTRRPRLALDPRDRRAVASNIDRDWLRRVPDRDEITAYYLLTTLSGGSLPR